jgi:putative membrane protein
MNVVNKSLVRKRVLLGAAALGLSAAATLSYAADPMTSATGGNVASADRTFIQKAAIGGMTEVEAGKLAQQKGSSQAVKDYGSRLVTDHTKANEELSKLATAKGVTPPGTLDSSHKNEVDKLSKKSGADFDKAFLKQMVSDHKSTISLFEKEAKSGKDGELQQFASATLPTLQEHLQMAQSDEKSEK